LNPNNVKNCVTVELQLEQLLGTMKVELVGGFSIGIETIFFAIFLASVWDL